MTVLAALLTGLAVWVLVPTAGGRAVRARLAVDPVVASAPRRRRRLVWVAPGVAAVSAGLVLGGPRGACLAAAAVSVVLTAVLVLAQRRRHRAAKKGLGEVARACGVLGSLITIGHVPAEALRLAAADCPVLLPVVHSQAVGGDVVAALRTAAGRPGQGGLRRLAQAWEVTSVTGAPIAPSLALVAESLRGERDLAQVVSGELASPRATTSVLVCLPVAGIALGEALGAQPLVWLTTGIAGPVCLLLGALLACLGVVVTERMVQSVERAQAGADA